MGWTTLLYALHAFSIATGIVGTATVIGAFLTGWPSIIAVILNYLKRGEARGTWLDSHFRWQIRTFWFGMLWVVLCGLLLVLARRRHRRPLVAARHGHRLVRIPRRARVAAAGRTAADVPIACRGRIGG